MHLLDSQISRALVQPSPWEVAQWRAAALKEKADWSALIDIGSSHRFCDEVQSSVEKELRRERAWCGPAPCVAAAAPVPTELARNEFYQARVHYSWARADARTEVAGKVSLFADKVALVSEGAVAPNARSVDPAHGLSQPSALLQPGAVATVAALNIREASAFTAHRLFSTLLEINWRFLHDGTGFRWVTIFAPTSSGTQSIAGTRNGTGAGANQFFSSALTGAQLAVTNATPTVIVSPSPGTAVLNTATCFDEMFLSPNFSHQVNSAAASTGTQSGTPAPGASDSTLCLGALGTGGIPAQMLWADMLISKVTSAALDTIIKRYRLLRYAF